ncbi:MAG: hypothetical protein RLZZ142_2482 [Verrucomicrobiota bacterium]
MASSPQGFSSRRSKPRSLLKTLVLSALGLVLVGGIGGVFFVRSWIESYLRSSAFRSRVESALGGVFHAQATLAPLQRTGSSLYSQALEARGLEQAKFRAIEAQGVEAQLDLRGLWQRTWQIQSLQAQRLDVDLRPQSAPKQDTPAEAVSASASSGIPEWLRKLLPNRAEFGPVRIQEVNVITPGLEARHLRVNATHTAPNWDVLAESGEVQIPSLPALDVATAKLSLAPDRCFIRSARLLLRTGGELTLSGDHSPAQTRIHTQFQNVPIESFLTGWWQSRLRGQLEGVLDFVRESGASPSRQISATLRLKGGRLEALPVLAQLDTFLGNPRFRQVPLKNASASIRSTPERTEVRNLDLDGDGLIRITGSLDITGRKLEGQLQLGISPSLIQWLPGGGAPIFSETRDGYAWTPLKLSGTLDAPSEDLSTRLAGALTKPVTDVLNKVLPNVPPAVPEAAKGLLDTLKSVIPGK